MSRQPNSKLSSSTALSRAAGKLSLMAILIATGAMVAPTKSFAIDAGELPSGGTVVGGGANFDYSQPNKLDVHQNTDRVVIDWDSFNIGTDATTQFYQPGSNSLAVNRVYSKGSDPTQILGKLIANGKVMVLDRNGVIFGRDSVVDVGGIIASTGDINVNQVMSGANKIDITNISDAAVVNNGLINAADAGLVGLVAKSAVNNGVIKAKVGRVALASGEKATVDLYGDQLIEIAVDSNLETALASNTGTINAEGGTVQMTASAAKNAVDNVVNMSGIINVSSVEVKGGKIILGGNGTTKVSGKAIASGKTGGGEIKVTGKDIEVKKGAILMADALETGNGGTVDVLADNNTIFEGDVYARGGSVSGNGGAVEISAKNQLGYDGSVNTTAANGEAGSLLFDPLFAIIHSGSLHNILGLQYILSAEALADDLARNGSLTVQADNSIDVGTDLPLLGNGPINLANYNYDTINTHGSPFPWNWTIDNHSGITSGNIVLKSATVNFNKDVTIGTGNLNVQANTINLNSKLNGYTGAVSGLLNDARLTSTAGTVNVLSNAAKIQQGLDLVDDNATVNVAAGTYNESLTINDKNVTLKGAKAGIAGDHASRGSGETIIAPNSPGIYITASGATIDGLTITGADNGIHADFGDTGAATTIKNNIITGSTQNGILGQTWHNQFIIQHNVIKNTTQTGIYIQGNSPASEISDNVITTTGDDGIYLYNTSNGTQVLRNKISAVGNTGLNIDGSQAVFAQLNEINGAGDYGIFAQDGMSGLTLDQNKIDNTGKDGIRLENMQTVYGSMGIVLSGNRIGLAGGNVAGDGIHVERSDSGRILGNAVYNVGKDGIVLIDGREIGTEILSNFIGAGGSAQNIGYINGGDGIFVSNTDGAIIQGNTIANTTYNASARKGSGILVVKSNDTIIGQLGGPLGNDITLAGSDGIVVRADGGSSDGNQILGNNIHGTGAAARTGIYVENSTNTGIIGNQVSGTGRYAAIYGLGGSDFDIGSNTINNNDEQGIRLENAGGTNTISSNYINDTGNDLKTSDGSNSGTAIYAKNVSNLTIDQNEIGLLGGANNINGTGIAVIDGNHVLIGGATDFDGNKIKDVASGWNNSGINISGGSDITISHNDLKNVGGQGIYAEGPYAGPVTTLDITNNTINGTEHNAIYVKKWNGADIEDNKIDGTTYGHGIQLELTTGTDVVGNTIKNAANSGVDLNYGNDTTKIQGNTLTGNKYGVQLETVGGQSNTNTLIGSMDSDPAKANTISGGVAGILVNGGGNLWIQNNDIKNTSDAGIDVSNSAGAYNIINYNKVNSTNDGIRVKGTTAIIGDNRIGLVGALTGNGIFTTGGDNTEILANQVSNVAKDGIKIEGGNGIKVQSNNDIKNAGRVGIYAANATNLLIKGNSVTGATSAIGYNYGAISTDWGSDITISNNTVSGTTDGILMYDVDGTNVISGNKIDNASHDGIFINQTSGLTISGNKIGQLAGNIGHNGITILNSGGTTINGGNLISNFADTGIYIDPSPSTNVVGNTITGGLYGVHVALDSDFSTVSGNTINGSTVAGILVDGGSDSAMIDTNIIKAAGGATGILVTSGDSHNILNNTIDGGTRGIWFSGAGDYSTISGNTIGQTTGTGYNSIEVSNSGSFTQVDGNHIYNAGWDAINIAGSGYTHVGGNDIHNTLGASGIAFVFHNGGGWIENNTIENSARLGIYVGDTDNLYITGNTITNSGTGNLSGPFGPFTAGIYLEQANGTTIDNNTIKGTTGAGIQVGGGGNWAASATSGNVISNNTIDNTGSHGVRILDSAGILVQDNLIGTNGGGNNINGDGVLVEKSAGAKVSGNTITNADLYGIRMLNMNGVTLIEDNEINDVGTDGIAVQGASDLRIHNNLLGLGADQLAGTADDTGFGNSGIRATNVLFASILDNLVANATKNGIYLGVGSANSAVVAGNEVTNSDIGMYFESGLIDLTGATNTIDGGRVGLHFQPTGLNSVNLVGNTIGSTEFTGQSKYYVELANGALFNPGTPTVIDGLGASYDGYLPNIDGIFLTQVQYDAIESRIFHYNDDNTLGLFFFGFAPEIDQSDIFRDIAGISGIAGRFNITIRGLPRIAGVTIPNAPAGNTGFSLNDITPAAGEEEGEQSSANPQNLQNIAPAAGANESVVEANSWNAAIDAASQGQVVNYSFSGDGSDALRGL